MSIETPQETPSADVAETASLFELALQHRERLIAEGRVPYGHKFEQNANTQDCIGDNYEEGREVRIAGRLTSCRNMGKTQFWDLRDTYGRIQLFVNAKAATPEAMELVKELVVGDIFGVTGTLFTTRTGEISIRMHTLTLLSKSLRPLPDKHHGMKDVEARFRQRYLDLASNIEVREIFRNRSKIIQSIRANLDNDQFLEVETPILQPLYGGATAKPFCTHHNALDMDLYLRIAPELYLKRLLVGGLDRVYELNRIFRNEGLSRKHNPEFTMLEVYQAYANYEDMMTLCEHLIRTAGKAIGLSDTWTLPSGATLSLDQPFHRLTMMEAVQKHSGLPITKASDIRPLAGKEGFENWETLDEGILLNEIFERHVEEKLIEPTFVIDYPAALSPLAKTRPENPDISERFELFIDGQEIANAYSELNDPVEQKKRFIEQIEQHAGNEEIPREVDLDYIRALEHGMPPAGGLGVGIDRLTMMLTGIGNIREVILFPLLRSEETD